jgi:hypothetical protein
MDADGACDGELSPVLGLVRSLVVEHFSDMYSTFVVAISVLSNARYVHAPAYRSRES